MGDRVLNVLDSITFHVEPVLSNTTCTGKPVAVADCVGVGVGDRVCGLTLWDCDGLVVRDGDTVAVELWVCVRDCEPLSVREAVTEGLLLPLREGEGLGDELCEGVALLLWVADCELETVCDGVLLGVEAGVPVWLGLHVCDGESVGLSD